MRRLAGLHHYAPKQLAKPLRQRIAQNLFDRPVRHVAVGLLAASRRLAQHHPVGRAVTGAAESLRIHERLQKVDRMPVHPLPVVGDPRRHPAQNVRRQMLHPNPRQNQKSRVVGEEADVAPPRFLVPADVAVARAEVARRAGPRQARDRPALRPHQILQVLAHRLFVAQIVMLLHQAVEQRLIAAAPHLRKLQRLDLVADCLRPALCRSAPAPAALVRASGLCGTNFTGGNSIWPARSSISSRPRHTMSRNAPLACFHCQASHSFFDSVRRLSPRVRGDQLPYIKDVFAADHPAAVLEFCHPAAV